MATRLRVSSPESPSPSPSSSPNPTLAPAISTNPCSGTIMFSPCEVCEGAPVRVLWSIEPSKASSHDWIGLFLCTEATNAHPVQHCYLKSFKGKQKGESVFKAPNKGTYEFRFIKSVFPFDTLSQNYLHIAKSGKLLVVPQTPRSKSVDSMVPRTPSTPRPPDPKKADAGRTIWKFWKKQKIKPSEGGVYNEMTHHLQTTPDKSPLLEQLESVHYFENMAKTGDGRETMAQFGVHTTLLSLATSASIEVQRVAVETLVQMCSKGVKDVHGSFMEEEAHRAMSFTEHWPHHGSGLTAERMAEAGLYFAPNEQCKDRCVCFACHGILLDWDAEKDDPWLEHCKWYKDCPFVRKRTNSVPVPALELDFLREKIDIVIEKEIFECDNFGIIVKMTQDEKPEIRRAATALLGDICSKLKGADRRKFLNFSLEPLCDILRNESDIATLTAAARSVAILSKSHELWGEMLDHDTIPSLLKCFTRSHEPKCLGSVAQSLAQLSPAASGDINNFNGIPALLAPLKDYKSYNVDVISWAAKALVNLAKVNEQSRQILKDFGGVRVLLEIITMQSVHNFDVQANAGIILAQLPESDVNFYFELAKLDGIKAIMILSKQQIHAELEVLRFCAKAFDALCSHTFSCLFCGAQPIRCIYPNKRRTFCSLCLNYNLCEECNEKTDLGSKHMHEEKNYMAMSTDTEWQWQVLESNGIEVIVNLLKHRDVEVHSAALRAIYSISQNDTNGERLLSKGSLPYIANMLLREGMESTQLVAVQTLGCLCVNEACKIAIREQYVVPAITALCTMKHSEEIRCAVVTTLCKLVEPPPDQSQPVWEVNAFEWASGDFVSGKGLEVLLQQANSPNPLIQRTTALALRHLCLLGVEKLLVGVVAEYRTQPILALALSENTSTSRLGLEVLCFLSSREENQRRLFLSGVMFPVLKLGAKTDIKLQEYACKIMLNLARHPENCKEMVGGDGSVLRLLFELARLSPDPSVQLLAIETQFALVKSKKNQKFFAERELLEVFSFLGHSDDSKCKFLVAEILEVLCINNALRTSLVDAGMVDVLIQLTRDPNIETQRCATSAIMLLSSDARRSQVNPPSPRSVLSMDSDMSPTPTDDGSSISGSRKIRVKCVFRQAEDEEQIKILLFTPDTFSYKTLRARLAESFGDCLIRYVDEEGDKVLASSDDDLRGALDFAIASQKKLKLHLAPDPHKLRRIPADSPGRVGSGVLGVHWPGRPNNNSYTMSTDAESTTSQHTSKKGSPTAQHGAMTVLSTLSDARRKGHLRWKKGHLLGRGAFGEVFEALCVDTGEIIAVKQVQLPSVESVTNAKLLASRLEAVQNLEKEIAFMRDLEHNNIVRYLGTEKSQNKLHIFLEFVSGGSIETLLNRYGPFDEATVQTYTRHTLHGLVYLHSRDIVHMDIKGGNLLVTEFGVVKLADFNSSQRLWDIAGVSKAEDSNPLKALCGSPPFMAPEVVKQSGHGKKADIWSLGCTIIQMLTASPPWNEHSTDLALFFQIASTKSPPKFPANISDDARNFLELCFIIEPSKRPSAKDLLQHPFVLDIQTPATAPMFAPIPTPVPNRALERVMSLCDDDNVAIPDLVRGRSLPLFKSSSEARRGNEESGTRSRTNSGGSDHSAAKLALI